MTIARTISIGIFVTFALAFGIAALDPVYAVTPCCSYVGGKYINLKTGKEVTPPKSTSTTKEPGTAQSPCCTYRNGVYINLKTGQPATPPSSMKASGGGTNSVSKSTSGGSTEHSSGGSTEHSSGGGGGGGSHK
jgi:hypothetical protein